jgi:hypothetical protein
MVQTSFTLTPQEMVFHSYNEAPSHENFGYSRDRPGITKQAKMKKNIPAPINTKKQELTKEEISKYFSYSQSTAAKMLGISVSTLKRRYYSMGLGKWPYQYAKSPKSSFQEKKGGLGFVLNKGLVDEKHLSKNVEKQLLNAFMNATSSPGTPCSADHNKFSFV